MSIVHSGKSLSSSAWELIKHNVPSLILIIVFSTIIYVLSDYIAHAYIGLATDLALAFFIILIFAAMVLLTRLYVREGLMTCRMASALTSGTVGLIFIASFSTLLIQRPILVLASFMLGIALALSVYKVTVVDVEYCAGRAR